jgi:nucleotide-binding universal stress UspA family protein
MKLERVVIGIDFSAPSLEAARWTAHHFARGAELVLVHAVHIPEPPRFLRGRYPEMDELVESARRGAEERLRGVVASLSCAVCATRVRTEVRVGEPSAVLAAAAADLGADLVVVGPHGERARPWNLLGTTAQHLVKLSPVPVLLATGVHDVHGATPRSLLVPLADGDVTPEVLRWTRLFAERFDARVTALHVVNAVAASHVLAAAPLAATMAQVQSGPWLEEIRGEADRWMGGLLAAGLPSDRVASEVTFGDTGGEILAAADRLESEMIVMGRRHDGGVRRALLGSITSEVLRGATCPVLVVGEPDPATER